MIDFSDPHWRTKVSMAICDQLRKQREQGRWVELKRRREQRLTFHSTLDLKTFLACPMCGTKLPTDAPCTFWKLEVPGVG